MFCVLTDFFFRSQCCAPDNIQRKCSRCIEADLPCEYVPVNHSPTTDIDPFLLGPQDTVPSQPQSPHFGPNPPTTSYDSSSAHPITSGWFGADSAQQQREKKKKRHYYGEQSLGGGQGWDAQPTWDDQNMRSNSLHRVPLKRSASRGHVNTLTYGHEPYSTLNLARRPRDWRPDYTPRGGIAALTAYLLGVGRSRSDVQGTCLPLPSFFSLLTLPRYRIGRSCPQTSPPTPPLGPPSSSSSL